MAGANADALAATFIDRQPPSGAAAKETRVGAPGNFAPGPRDQLKETRIGAGPAAALPQGFAPPQGYAPRPAPQPTDQQAAPSTQGVTDQTTVGAQHPGGTTVLPVENPNAAAPVVATEAPAQGPNRTATKAPAQTKKVDSTAAERERKRKAALDALNQ